MNQQITEQQAIEERQKYVLAFNDTMIKIWEEQKCLLGKAITTFPLECSTGD